MSLPSDADASVLRDRVAALAARVEELETEAEADRALYPRIGMGHTDPELKAKPESEVFGALEQQNRDALYELKKTKSQKYQLKQRVDELEKALESAASAEPVTLTIVTECARSVERADAEAEAEEEARAEAAAAEAKAEEEARAAAEAKAKAKARGGCEDADARAPCARGPDAGPDAHQAERARRARRRADVLSAHARGDASSAMSCAALHLCMKHRDQCSNAESLMRRTIAVMKNEVAAGRRGSGVGFGPGKELAGALRTTKTGLEVVAEDDDRERFSNRRCSRCESSPVRGGHEETGPLSPLERPSRLAHAAARGAAVARVAVRSGGARRRRRRCRSALWRSSRRRTRACSSGWRRRRRRRSTGTR